MSNRLFKNTQKKIMKIFMFSFLTITFLGSMISLAPNVPSTLDNLEVTKILENETALDNFSSFIIEKGVEMQPDEFSNKHKETLNTLLKNNVDLQTLDQETLNTLMLKEVRNKIDSKHSNFQSAIGSSVCGSRGFCCVLQGGSKVACCRIYCYNRCAC